MKKLAVMLYSVCGILVLLVSSLMATPVEAAESPILAKGKQILWRMNFPLPAKGRIEYDHVQFACDEIHKRSNGRLKIEIYPRFSLGHSPKTWLRDMRDGAIDISDVYAGYIAGEEPSFTVIEVPHLWESRAQNLLAMEALFPFKKRVYKDVWNSELIASGSITSAQTHLNTRKKQIRTLDDAKGLKIRILGARYKEIWERLGVAPQTMPLGEVYMAVKTGVVDGAITGASAIYSTKLHEVLDYAVALPPIQAATFDIVVSNKQWAPLPDDLKQIVRDVFIRWGIASKARALQAKELDDIYWQRKCEDEGKMVYSTLPKEDYAKIQQVAKEILVDWVYRTGGRTLEAYALVRPIISAHTEAGKAENFFEEYEKTLKVRR